MLPIHVFLGKIVMRLSRILKFSIPCFLGIGIFIHSGQSQGSTLPGSSEEARQEIATRLAQDPSDPFANYLDAFWQFAELAESDEFQAMFVSLGLPQGFMGTTVFDDPSQYGEEFELDRSFQVSEALGYFEDTVLPVFEGLDTRFATLGQGEAIVVSQQDYPDLQEDIKIDYADSRVLKALVNFYLAVVRVKLAYNWNLDLGSFLALDEQDLISLEAVRDTFLGFGSVRDAALLAQAKTNLQSAIDYYLEASPLIRDGSRTQGLFLLEPADMEDEKEFMGLLTELESTLGGQYTWSTEDPVFTTANLSPFFAGNVDFSVLMPHSIGDQFVDTPLVDPTLGGMFPLLTEQLIRGEMDPGTFSGNVWAGVSPLFEPNWWNPSPNVNWWRSHWFGLFFRQSPSSWQDYDTRTFPDDWMYHMWLGWVYPVASSPASVWLWLENADTWAWTSSAVFPFFYSATDGLWNYVSESDGRLYKWDGSSWIQQ